MPARGRLDHAGSVPGLARSEHGPRPRRTPWDALAEWLSPWAVLDVEIQLEEQCVDVFLAPGPDVRPLCSRCREETQWFDARCLYWDSVRVGGYEIRFHLRIPRIPCHVHGRRGLPLPRPRMGPGFGRLLRVALGRDPECRHSAPG